MLGIAAQLAAARSRQNARRMLLVAARIYFLRWRRAADVRIRAMHILRRWREPRMRAARRTREARTLLRRALEEWFTDMLVHRAMRGGFTYARKA